MGFMPANLERLCRFNSAESSDFLQLVDNASEAAIRKHNESKPSQTISPSSFRCPRKTWFKLRGTDPDVKSQVDTVTDWLACIGTAAHEVIQKRLREYLEDDWVSADKYIQDNAEILDWANDDNYEVEQNKEETRVHIFDPHIKFSVDGLVNFHSKIWLFEIKTMEVSSFRDIAAPREKDLDQIKLYGSLLKIHNVFILYVDRVYGEYKCFEYTIPDYIFIDNWEKIQKLQKSAEFDVAPERLPKNDIWCSECIYKKSCDQWG